MKTAELDDLVLLCYATRDMKLRSLRIEVQFCYADGERCMDTLV